MGDLRNKYAKIARDLRVKAIQAALEAKPAAATPRCACGHTTHERPLWAWSGDRKIPAGIFCVACMPPGILNS